MPRQHPHDGDGAWTARAWIIISPNVLARSIRHGAMM